MKSFNDWENEEDQIDESLSISARRRKAMALRRAAPKIKRGRERAKRKMASREVLLKRATKQARMFLFKKLSKGKSPPDVSFAQRKAIEDKLRAKSAVIARISKKLFPKVKKSEIERLKKFRSSDDD
tara:strand:+ start:712 stop:1092 length:381 start_codon:yes stop_codon:yes gene_type:complete